MRPFSFLLLGGGDVATAITVVASTAVLQISAQSAIAHVPSVQSDDDLVFTMIAIGELTSRVSLPDRLTSTITTPDAAQSMIRGKQ